MNSVETRRYEMLVRVRDFGVAKSGQFPSSTVGGQAFAAVAAAVASLNEHAAAHLSGRGSAREGRASKAVAREALRDDLDAIVRTARALALDMPGLDDKFRAPRGSGDQAVLSAARAFIRDATPLAQAFISHDMPADFLEDLAADIREFEDATREQEAGKDTHVLARAAIEAAMELGLDAVRRLDAVVPNRLRNDDAALATWERARRVEYRSGRARGETPAPPPVTDTGVDNTGKAAAT
jgi:hypothetical protein